MDESSRPSPERAAEEARFAWCGEDLGYFPMVLDKTWRCNDCGAEGREDNHEKASGAAYRHRLDVHDPDEVWLA